jgi:hypothetical protein
MILNYQPLIKHWESQGIRHAIGATVSEIESFQSVYGVCLPNDLRKYFLEVNGFSQLSAKENDDRGFRFLSLESVTRASDELKELTGSYPSLPNAENFFVFAEYLQWSWGYAVELGKEHQGNVVIPIGKFSYPRLATSFSQFIRLYLSNDPQIYAG